ncbi:membrane protein insertase YidC [Lutibaculum baratangense]|uniref:Membrane protein insertase YidC n=1 Tax=Lutibaculum baratangense AMV1 TaxID=631454 RepID=V4TMK6_9HYPH|nr:membrane protein insertase YidC [Lutibaculum baratangense]ESR26978.1 Inner membrane protein translocase component YidC, long form [Lutibaculum baratangense AMV1]
MDDSRNYIIAIVLSILILVGWQYFIVGPQTERQQATIEAQQEAQTGIPQPQSSAPGTPAAPGAPSDHASPTTMTRDQALQQGPRVPIRTPSIEGSISLVGARIDDVVLRDYRVTVERDSPNVVLLSPSGAPLPYYAEQGFVSANAGLADLPSSRTEWEAPEGAELTPDTPVTLTYRSESGLVFQRTITVDENYMFTVSDTVTNEGGEAATFSPYALVSRHGLPSDLENFFILHEGLIGVLGEHGLKEVDYDDVAGEPAQQFAATGGWLGITDKYWAAALVPPPDAHYQARFSSGTATGGKISYQSDYLLDPIEIAPGATASVESYVFAGAKRTDLLDSYEATLGIERFELLIDWGWFHFITKPLFSVLHFFSGLVGNFGVAILIVTVLVKAVFFPLANKSYVSMSRMKLVQPKMMEIREKYKDDRMKQQQEMMELYKKEKINPLSGCLPIVVQIPVFFALYKVIFVTIEMRHAPFFGWIQDLSAPDPTTLFNLFGLIPWSPPELLMVGIWPIIMGITMWVQMRLNPPPPDPTSAMVFNWMPLIFTFMLARFPAGLVIYWAWNNTLSVLQQYVIMRRQGVKPDILGNIRASFSKSKPDNDSDGSSGGSGTAAKSGAGK